VLKSLLPKSQNNHTREKQRSPQKLLKALSQTKALRHFATIETHRVQPSTTKLIILVPQYHRSEDYPINWSSIGKKVAQVQNNIEDLILHLYYNYGISCWGVEGRSANTIRESPVLNMGLSAVRTLAIRFQNLHQEFKEENSLVLEESEKILALLSPFIVQHIQAADGVAMALIRIGSEGNSPGAINQLQRLWYGIENKALNERAVQLLKDIRQTQKEILSSQTVPTDPTSIEGQDFLRNIWFKEFPPFNKKVIKPISKKLKILQEILRQIRDGPEKKYRTLRHFIRNIQGVYALALSPRQIISEFDYYSNLDSPPPSTNNTGIPLSSTNKKSLKTKLSELYEEYADITFTKREKRAIGTTLKKVDKAKNSTCVLVMGANHQSGLIEQLTKLDPNHGFLVLDPYRPVSRETPEAP